MQNVKMRLLAVSFSLLTTLIAGPQSGRSIGTPVSECSSIFVLEIEDARITGGLPGSSTQLVKIRATVPRVLKDAYKLGLKQGRFEATIRQPVGHVGVGSMADSWTNREIRSGQIYLILSNARSGIEAMVEKPEMAELIPDGTDTVGDVETILESETRPIAEQVLKATRTLTDSRQHSAVFARFLAQLLAVGSDTDTSPLQSALRDVGVTAFFGPRERISLTLALVLLSGSHNRQSESSRIFSGADGEVFCQRNDRLGKWTFSLDAGDSRKIFAVHPNVSRWIQEFAANPSGRSRATDWALSSSVFDRPAALPSRPRRGANAIGFGDSAIGRPPPTPERLNVELFGALRSTPTQALPSLLPEATRKGPGTGDRSMIRISTPINNAAWASLMTAISLCLATTPPRFFYECSIVDRVADAAAKDVPENLLALQVLELLAEGRITEIGVDLETAVGLAAGQLHKPEFKSVEVRSHALWKIAEVDLPEALEFLSSLKKEQIQPEADAELAHFADEIEDLPDSSLLKRTLWGKRVQIRGMTPPKRRPK